jgi:hypothetical protein
VLVRWYRENIVGVFVMVTSVNTNRHSLEGDVIGVVAKHVEIGAGAGQIMNTISIRSTQRAMSPPPQKTHK